MIPNFAAFFIKSRCDFKTCGFSERSQNTHEVGARLLKLCCQPQKRLHVCHVHGLVKLPDGFNLLGVDGKAFVGNLIACENQFVAKFNFLWMERKVTFVTLLQQNLELSEHVLDSRTMKKDVIHHLEGVGYVTDEFVRDAIEFIHRCSATLRQSFVVQDPNRMDHEGCLVLVFNG